MVLPNMSAYSKRRFLDLGIVILIVISVVGIIFSLPFPFVKLSQDSLIPFPASSHEEETGGIEISKTLRGKHTIYTEVKNPPLHIDFWTQDANFKIGPDRFHVNFFRENTRMLYTLSMEDDGDIQKSRKPSNIKIFHLSTPKHEHFSPGVYRIDLDLSSDFLIRKIRTNQEKLVFGKQLFLADNRGYQRWVPSLRPSPTALVAKGRTFSFKTNHRTGIQTVKIGKKKVKISRLHRQFQTTLPINESTGLVIPKNDLIVTSDGVFAFSQDHLFDPF